jgi:hypothetical protein
MHESERNRVINEIQKLRLAEEDMAQAAMAASYLANKDLNDDLCRALETAVAVCYARPFGRNGVGMLGPEWLPADDHHPFFHDALLEVRDQVYAHTDRTTVREVVQVGEGSYAEAWLPFSRKARTHFIELARYQEARFRAGVEERQKALHP